MNKILKQYWIYLVFLLLAIVLPLIWLKGDYTFISEEDNFANYQNVVYKNLYSWSRSLNNGNPVSPAEHSTIIPNGIFYYLLSQANIPSYQIQKIYLSLIILFTLLSIAYLINLFTKNKLIILITSFFYYFNFYTKSTIFYTAKMYQLILMPLFFVWFHKYLETKKYRYAIYNYLALFLLQAIFSNLPMLLVTCFIYFIVIPHFIIKNNLKFVNFFKENILRLIVFFIPLISLFFYHGLIYYYSYLSNNTFETIKKGNTFTAIFSAMNLILQLRGSWWEFASFEDVSYNPWLWFYGNPINIFLSYLLIGFLVYLLFIKKYSKIYLYWFLVFILGLCLSSGSSAFPPLYNWLYVHVPFFYVFREPWGKFMPIFILALSVLLSLGLGVFKKKYILYFLLFIIIIRSLPFFSYDFIVHKTRRWSIPFIKLPSYWYDYEKWSTQNINKNVLSIPVDNFQRDWYKENLGNADHPLTKLFYTNTVYNLNNNNLGFLIKYFVERNNPYFVKIAGVDYALLQEDVTKNTKYYSSISQEYSKLIKQQFESNPIREFGKKLFLYKVKNNYSTPLIYTAGDTIVVGGIDAFSTILSKPDFSNTSVAYLKSQNMDKIKMVNDYLKNYHNGDSKKLQYTTVNTTKYIVSLKGIKGYVPIIFSQNYHLSWGIYPIKIKDYQKTDILYGFIPSNLFRKRLSENTHLIANGYANSWLIKSEEMCKDFKEACKRNADESYDINFVIEYSAQNIFNIGLILQILTFIGSVIYLTYLWIRKILSKNK